jgi:GH24 family phage-related lysozyme (muramidase)
VFLLAIRRVFFNNTGSLMPDPNLASSAFNLISKYEGFKDKPYRDNNKKKWTVGVGTLIGDGSDEAYQKSQFYNKTIDKATAESLAKADIEKKIGLVSKLVGEDTFSAFSPELQSHLVSGAYRGDITGSPNTIAKLKGGDFSGAAKEFLDSEEYRKAAAAKSGVAKRMEELSATIAAEKPKVAPAAAPKKAAEPLLDFSSAVEAALLKMEKARPTS